MMIIMLFIVSDNRRVRSMGAIFAHAVSSARIRLLSLNRQRATRITIMATRRSSMLPFPGSVRLFDSYLIKLIRYRGRRTGMSFKNTPQDQDHALSMGAQSYSSLSGYGGNTYVHREPLILGGRAGYYPSIHLHSSEILLRMTWSAARRLNYRLA